MIAHWQLAGNTAALLAAAWNAKIDLTTPQLGLALRFSGAAQNKSPLQILGAEFGDRQPIEPQRIDAYVRGPDLVTTYGEAPPERLRSQVYWRVLPAGEFAADFSAQIAVAFDLILSSNTSLLDSDPQSNIRSLIPNISDVLQVVRADTTQLLAEQIAMVPKPSDSLQTITATPEDRAAGCFITRLDGVPYSYVEMVHPADFHRSTLTLTKSRQTDETSSLIKHQLFHERLEKGVILRARLRAALVDSQQDEAAALAAYNHFAAAEPPLTV
ncbi:MAG TPA: hypothetical protein VGJ04_05420 [Pirellulales bacterium]